MIKTDIDAEGFATLTIDMAERPMNVIDYGLTAALDEAFSRLAANDAVKGIILTSGKSSFVAGADLGIFKDFRGPGTSPATASRKIKEIGDVLRRIETCGKPVVAAAPGTALGGGLELMLCSHYRIAAGNPKALFGVPEVTLGLLPGAGGTQRLPRLVGLTAAVPMLVSGKTLSADEALSVGILNAVVPSDQLITAAKDALRDGVVDPVAPWDKKGFKLPGAQPNSQAMMDYFIFENAKKLAETRGNYPAPKAVLSCVFEGSRLPIDKGLKVEQDYFGTLVHDETSTAMIRTLFFGRLATQKAGDSEGSAKFVDALRRAYVDEGLALAGEGVPHALIDNTALAAGMRAGPLAIAREAGLSIAEAEAFVDMTTEDIRDRLMAIQVLAAINEAGDNANWLELDYAAVTGLGFPAFVGGPFGYVDRIGAAEFAVRAEALASGFGDRFKPPHELMALAQSHGRFYPEESRAA